MKKILPLLVIMIIIFSCRKSSPEFTIPPGNLNHEVKAMVSVKGGSFSSFNTSGNSTVYGKRTDPNGDVVIVFAGSDVPGQIQITLVNISSAGVYTVGGGGPAGSQYIMGSFSTGNPLTGPYEFFSVPGPLPPSGSITLDELTANSVRGSFVMTCTGTTGTIQITNGTFKGTF